MLSDALLVNACRSGLTDVVRQLLAEGVDPSKNNNLAINVAAKSGHLAAVNLLLQDERVGGGAQAALVCAVRCGRLAVVKRLLQDSRVNPIADSGYPLREAALHGHLAVVNQLLQDERVDPADGGNQALIQAVYHGRLEIVRRLLRDNRVSMSPETIYCVARNGHARLLRELLGDARVVAGEVDVEALESAARDGGPETREAVREWREEVGRY